jgi:hypothetical protein
VVALGHVFAASNGFPGLLPFGIPAMPSWRIPGQ